MAHFQGILGYSKGQNGPPRAQELAKTTPICVLSHIVQDSLPLVWGYLRRVSQILGLFQAFLGAFLRHIVELEGTKGVFDTRKSTRTWSVPTISLCGRFEQLLGLFWAKKTAIFGQKKAQILGAPPNLAPAHQGAISEFLAQNLDLARPPPRL